MVNQEESSRGKQGARLDEKVPLSLRVLCRRVCITLRAPLTASPIHHPAISLSLCFLTNDVRAARASFAQPLLMLLARYLFAKWKFN